MTHQKKTPSRPPEAPEDDNDEQFYVITGQNIIRKTTLRHISQTSERKKITINAEAINKIVDRSLANPPYCFPRCRRLPWYRRLWVPIAIAIAIVVAIAIYAR